MRNELIRLRNQLVHERDTAIERIAALDYAIEQIDQKQQLENRLTESRGLVEDLLDQTTGRAREVDQLGQSVSEHWGVWKYKVR